MRRPILIAVTVVLVSIPAWAQDVSTGPPTLMELSIQAVNLDSALRRTRDAAARRRLLGELEKVKHQMGPHDATGKRVKCQAMWHDTALASLETEIKRLSHRPSGSKPKPMVADARLHVRRMAAACLTHGWRMPSDTPKYQVDVFGQYLVNNARVLEALFESLSDAEAREAKADAQAGDRAAAKAALEQAKTGIEQMGQAAAKMTALPSSPAAALVPLLGQFVQGLAAARDAEMVLREDAQAGDVAKADDATTQTETPEPVEAPPMTEAEKARIAKVKAVAAALEGDDWTTVSRYLERFAAAVEAGFTVARARPQAREFLGEVERAAELAQGLQASKIITPEYLKSCRDELADALEMMQSPLKRASGYADLGDVQAADHLRRQIEAASLTDKAAAGIVQTYYVLAPKLEASAAAVDVATGKRLESLCRAVARTFDKMRYWPPEGMSPQLRECYERQAAIFGKEIEEAGPQLPATPVDGLPLLASAASRASDLALIVRAASVLEAVKKYRPARTGAVTAQVTHAAQDLVVKHATPAARRQTLAGLVKPLEDLDAFPIAGPEYRRVVNRLGGRGYAAAQAVLSMELGAGIDAAAAGDPAPLRRALGATHLFGLMRKRAMAEAAGLHKAGAANLVTFSVPEKIWQTFVDHMDKRLRVMFAEYARSGRRVPWLRVCARWAAVYGPVVAGQRQTLDARLEGEGELDFLIRNLQRTAVPDPPAARAYAWYVGYHATEAAATMNAGFDAAADWHRDQMDGYDTYLRRVELDPGRKAKGAAK